MTVKPWMVGVLAGLLCFWGWSCHERQVGSLHARIAQLEQHKTQVDTVYKTQTKTLTVVRHKTDSVLTTDTLWRSDTVRILLASERKACDLVVQTCEQRVAVRDSLIAVLKKQRAKWFACVIGGTASDRGVRPGVGCGLRL